MIPEQPVDFWQYFDFYILALLTIFITYLLLLHRRKNGALLSTISQTIAHSKNSSLSFSIIMTICYPLYYGFLWYWVGPLTRMPAIFYILLIVSAVFEVIFVWVPSKSGRQKRIHEFAAGVVGIFMFASILLILILGNSIHNLAVLFCYLFLLTSLIMSWLLIFKKYRKHIFAFEVIYISLFLITISLVAHT
jgi:hypothetical protein